MKVWRRAQVGLLLELVVMMVVMVVVMVTVVVLLTTAGARLGRLGRLARKWCSRGGSRRCRWLAIYRWEICICALVASGRANGDLLRGACGGAGSGAG